MGDTLRDGIALLLALAMAVYATSEGRLRAQLRHGESKYNVRPSRGRAGAGLVEAQQFWGRE
jgi:hypothetical protein